MRRWHDLPLIRTVRVQGALWREFLVRAGEVQADILLTIVFVVAVGTSWLVARVARVRFFGWRRGAPAWIARPAEERGLSWMERQG